MALTRIGNQPTTVVTNTTPATVGVPASVDIPQPLGPVAGYLITWVVATAAAPDYFTLTAGRPDGTGLDLGDYDTTSTTGVYVRGPLSDVTATPVFAPASTGEVTLYITEMASVPESTTVQRMSYIDNTTATPLVITMPSGVDASNHEYEFSLVGTWGGGATITPTETEPGGYTSTFGALIADYRCARRIGPVAGFQVTLAAIPAAGVLFTSTHLVRV